MSWGLLMCCTNFSKGSGARHTSLSVWLELKQAVQAVLLLASYVAFARLCFLGLAVVAADMQHYPDVESLMCFSLYDYDMAVQ